MSERKKLFQGSKELLARLGRWVYGPLAPIVAAPIVAALTVATFIVAALGGPTAAWAQGQAPGDPAYFNPKPDDSDLVIPMPCGLSMVFKLVMIPAAGFLGDMELKQGTLGQNGKGFVDRPFQTPLASSLKLENFTGTMAEKVAAAVAGKTDYQLYLIGKYEVSVGQWQAVMEGCPAIGPGSELPKANVSKNEALFFTERYMSWLLKNSPESLPKFPADAKYVGFLRLPTEAEWEYAARGGQAVTPEDLEKEKLFPNPKRLSLSSFAYFSAEDGEREGPQPIGRLEPNPLGLYDTGGNVSELSLDAYRISIGSRLQGTEGGNLLKGGSYLDSGAGILPGARVEIPKFTANGQVKTPYMGFRLAVSAPNAADRQRTLALQQEFLTLPPLDSATQQGLEQMQAQLTGEPALQPKTLDPNALKLLSPVDRINGLLPFVESPGQKTALAALMADFQRYDQIRAVKTFAQAKALFNSVLFAAYGVRDTSLRYNTLLIKILHEQAIIVDLTTKMKNARGAAQKGEFQAQIDQAQKNVAALNAGLADFTVALENQFAYYKSSLQQLTQHDPAVLGQVAAQVREEYKGNDSYSQTMNNAMEVTVRDIQLFLSEQDARVVLANVALPPPKQ
ncbi:MAG: formylglycine-generating enzyme family protein [Deltaproteobacteria bacterium]|jgi:hypothetical protein|nr:formylglycine-generating enzyme family protein [Deltaproteobacteria bacterium]